LKRNGDLITDLTFYLKAYKKNFLFKKEKLCLKTQIYFSKKGEVISKVEFI